MAGIELASKVVVEWHGVVEAAVGKRDRVGELSVGNSGSRFEALRNIGQNRRTSLPSVFAAAGFKCRRRATPWFVAHEVTVVVEAIAKGPFVMPRATFSLKASEAAWRTFWQPVPPPGCHDLIAMIKTGTLALDGDQLPFFANLRYFKELLALPRPSAQTAAAGGVR